MTIEKAKRDIQHPFAYDLVDGEDVLWASGGNPPSIRRALKTYGIITIAIMVVVFFAAAFDNDKDALKIAFGAAMFTGIGALIGLPFLLLYQMFSRTRQPERMYAVTNARLFMRVKGKTYFCAISSLPQVIKFEGSQGRGTLNFGATFGNFADIPDVNYVYNLITGLQKKQAFLAS